MIGRPFVLYFIMFAILAGSLCGRILWTLLSSRRLRYSVLQDVKWPYIVWVIAGILNFLLLIAMWNMVFITGFDVVGIAFTFFEDGCYILGVLRF